MELIRKALHAIQCKIGWHNYQPVQGTTQFADRFTETALGRCVDCGKTTVLTRGA